MSFNLTRELGKHLQVPGAGESLTSTTAAIIGNKPIVAVKRVLPKKILSSKISSTSVSTLDNRPVLQLNALPMTLSPNIYKNAYSSANPDGSFTSLYAFSQLVNPVPSFTEYYSASLNSISSVYKNLVHGASVKSGKRFTGSVLAEALQAYDTAVLSNMDGIPGSWQPVYATPVDWYDISDPGRFNEINIDLTGDDDDEGPYQVLKSSDNNNILSTLINNDNGSSVSIDKSTSLKSVKFKYLEVRLNRPWLRSVIFNLGGWFIEGQKSGFFSSGSTAKNQGVLPLITTSMLVAIDVDLAAEWSVKDQQVINDENRKGNEIAVGPFVLNADQVSEPKLHVIGWVSQLVPLAPQIDN